jgi:hypothetical protein
LAAAAADAPAVRFDEKRRNLEKKELPLEIKVILSLL